MGFFSKKPKMSRYGWKRDIPDFRDVRFCADSPEATALPASVDLRSICPPIQDQSSLGCHDDITEVLTISGWKLFKDVNKGEKLATINPNTYELSYEVPTKLLNFPYKGNMICAKNKSLDFKVTPNHKMLVKKWVESKRTLSEKFSFVEAKDLGWYTGLLNNITYKGTNPSDTYILKGVEHKHKLQRSDRIIPMGLWLKLLGIYLAEGTMCKDFLHYKIQLACVKEREKIFIKELLNDLNLNYCELKDRITFDNKQIYKTLESYNLKGVQAPFKFVPSFVFEQSPDNIKQFLLGHFNGDGCEQSGGEAMGFKSHYTSSIKLANDLQLLIYLSGSDSYISIREPRTSVIKGRIVHGKYPEYRVGVCEKKHVSIDAKEALFEEYYDGIVYCAEVPSYHTLITKRNQKLLISGNSCTAHGLTAAIEILQLKDKKPLVMLSRLFLYYNERAAEGTTNSDSGAAIRDGIKVLASQGCCMEALWPYNINRFTQKPNKNCYNQAVVHDIIQYSALHSLNDMKTCLAQGFPFVFGFTVYSSFESDAVAKTGIMPMPLPTESCLGGHCVIAVGYDDKTQTMLIRNSWSSSWGDKGYFHMPYTYISNPQLASDFWTIRKTKSE
jgi:hypothetical protein